MSKVKFTKRELWFKEAIGLPFYFVLTIGAYLAGDGSVLITLLIMLVGFYVYNLAYWKLYQRFIIKSAHRNHFKLYGFLLLFQALSIGGVIYAIEF